MSGLDAAVTNSAVSRPFVVAAVVFVFAGSAIGAVYLMVLLGAELPIGAPNFSVHRILQMDGFLTTMVMGIGYMIVPRFRNSVLPSTPLAYASLLLVLASVALSVIDMASGQGSAGAIADALRLAGTAIFGAIVFWMLRVRPKLLGLADYFIGLSAATLVTASALRVIETDSQNYLGEVQIWMLFPIFMIFWVEYKTLPSFLGFIRPRKRFAQISFVLATGAMALGLFSTQSDLPLISVMFNLLLLSSAGIFATSLFLYGGFDSSEIRRFLSGEKKARYTYTLAYSRLAFVLLFAGISFAATYYMVSDEWSFLFYDLAIHYTAIGFVGTTVALYLPLMLPPIIGKQVRFARFSHAPVLMLLSSLLLRIAGDFFVGSDSAPTVYVLMSSGWLVVSALLVFVITLHRSMRAYGTQ